MAEATARTESGTAAPAGGRPRILIVEDEVLVRMVAVDELLDRGCQVEEAGSAAEALAVLDGGGTPLAAVVVDVGLPDGRGDSLAAEIRQRFPKLPVLVASGYDPRDLALPKDDPLIATIAKPYSPEGLVAALEALRGPLRG